MLRRTTSPTGGQLLTAALQNIYVTRLVPGLIAQTHKRKCLEHNGQDPKLLRTVVSDFSGFQLGESDRRGTPKEGWMDEGTMDHGTAASQSGEGDLKGKSKELPNKLELIGRKDIIALALKQFQSSRLLSI